jgi:hypothetical protein
MQEMAVGRSALLQAGHLVEAMTIGWSAAAAGTNQSRQPQCGQGASPGGIDGSSRTSLPQVKQ